MPSYTVCYSDSETSMELQAGSQLDAARFYYTNNPRSGVAYIMVRQGGSTRNFEVPKDLQGASGSVRVGAPKPIITFPAGERKFFALLLIGGGVAGLFFAFIQLNSLQSQILRAMGQGDSAGTLLAFGGIGGVIAGLWILFATKRS